MKFSYFIKFLSIKTFQLKFTEIYFLIIKNKFLNLNIFKLNLLKNLFDFIKKIIFN